MKDLIICWQISHASKLYHLNVLNQTRFVIQE